MGNRLSEPHPTTLRVREELITCLQELELIAQRDAVGIGLYTILFRPFERLYRSNLRRPIPRTSEICDQASQRLPYRPSAWDVTNAIREIARRSTPRIRAKRVQ